MRIDNLKKYAHNILEEQRVECEYIEYKKSATQKDKILKTLCAYANNYMNRDYGLLFIGVEEVNDKIDGIKAIPKRPITGLTEGQLEGIENSIKSLFKYIIPTPTCYFIPDKIDDKWYLVVVIEPSMRLTEVSEKGANVVNLPKGGRYIRISRDTILPSPRQEFELLRKFAGYSFCDDFHDTATLNDLNYEYMKEYLVRSNAAEDLIKLSKERMAKTLKLVGEDSSNENRVKNFALLMFADRPEDYIKGAHVEIITESDDGTSRMSAVVFDGPIWIQAEKVRKYFKEDIERSYTLRTDSSITHRKVFNWPSTAWNEFSTNMIVHKNYDNPNYAGIYVYPNRISFVNHNRPVPPISIQDLNEKETFDIREYLNPQIKDMFHNLKLIESYGSGIRRAKKALSDNGNPKPEFLPHNENDDYTQVVMYINEEYKEYHDEDRIIKLIDIESLKLSDIEIKVYEIIKSNPSITFNELAEKVSKSSRSIKRYISKLVNLNLIERENGNKYSPWKIL